MINILYNLFFQKLIKKNHFEKVKTNKIKIAKTKLITQYE
jgi:hypothetical protein